MNICIIGCWYRDDIYSHHFYSLSEKIKNDENINVKLVTSNCNCYSSSQKYSIAKDELLNNNCQVTKIPYAPLNPNKDHGLFKYYVVKLLKLNYFFEIARGISFSNKTKHCNIIHFDQVLRSFGILSFSTLLFLAKAFNKKVVITVHELDPLQNKYKGLTKYYNKADRIIVFSHDFKDDLVNLGVNKSKIEVIPYGVSIEALKGYERDQFIFFGGHNLLRGKGFYNLVNAIEILVSKGKNPRLMIYVGEGCLGLEEGKQNVSGRGLDKYIEWREFLYGSKLAEEYQKSIACIIPYTGGSGRYPATTAMANATPVIATRKASLPEYLEKLGVYIREDSPEELAEALSNLMNDQPLVKSLGLKLRERAERLYSFEVVAQKTLQVYHEI